VKHPVITADVAYTFADYFNFEAGTKDVLSHFGHSFERRMCALPRSGRELGQVRGLRERIAETLPYLSLTNDTARREFLIAPVLLGAASYTRAEINIGTQLRVSDQLQGALDYHLQARSDLIVVAARDADLTRGFMQLAVELVAMEQWTESQAPEFYGAVSIGDIWQFGILDREAKRVTQDLNLYRVPADLSDLMSILVGILVG
jgi:hypothetical protein